MLFVRITKQIGINVAMVRTALGTNSRAKTSLYRKKLKAWLFMFNKKATKSVQYFDKSPYALID